MPLYQLKIKTLSPIHIGDGDLYDGMTLLEDKEYFYSIDFNLILKAFEKYRIPFDNFKKWVIDNKGIRFQRKPRLADFLRDECSAIQQEVKQFLISNSGQKIKNLCQVQPNTDIETCIKDINQKPYIPGSEVKGALTTAIMFHFLKTDDHFYNDLMLILEKYLPFLDQVYDGMKKIKTLQKKKKDEGYQFFKQLNLPRSDWNKIRRIFSMRERPIPNIQKELASQLGYPPAEVTRIISSVQKWRARKQQISQDIWKEKRKYDKKRIGWIAEEIKEVEEKYWKKYLMSQEKNPPIGAKVMRFIQISDTNTNGQSKIAPCLIVHHDPNITMNLFYEIIDSNYNFTSNIRIDKQDVILNNLQFSTENKAILAKESLLRWVYDFSKEVIKEDIFYFEALNTGLSYRFPVKKIMTHLADLQKANTPEAPLLRIGKAQGFLSLTLATLIKKYDQQHGSDIYSKLLGVVQSDKNNPDSYPITRRLITDGAGEFKLPGWIKLELIKTPDEN